MKDAISYIRDVGKKQANQQIQLNMDQQYALDMGGERQMNFYDYEEDVSRTKCNF